MKIESIEVIPLVVDLGTTFKGSFYSMSERATLVTRIYTDDGIIGEIYNGDEINDQIQIREIILNEIFPIIKGTDPLHIEKRWDEMQILTKDILRDRSLVIKAISSVDSALWDIVGKTAGLSLSKLWGSYHEKLPIIAIGGYYGRTNKELAEEVLEYKELGLAGCKMKVGGSTPEEDSKRFIEMRKAGGDDFILIADANQGYTTDDAIKFCKLVENYNLDWFEEPVGWINDRYDLKTVRFKSGLPIAAGQSETSRRGILDLITSDSIDICNFDASWGGGPSEWIRVANMCEVYGIKMAHHEEPQISSQMLSSFKKSKYVECFHPQRDPLFWNIIENRPGPKDGFYKTLDDPGWGIILDKNYIKKYQVI